MTHRFVAILVCALLSLGAVAQGDHGPLEPDDPIAGGHNVRVGHGSICTVGFPVTGKHTDRTGVLTAGHCDPALGSSTLSEGRYVGERIRKWDRGAVDASVVETVVPTPPRLYGGITVRRPVEPIMGRRVCMVGRINGLSCGEVVPNDPDYGFHPDMIQTTLVEARRGDSGAPIFHPHNGDAYPIGVLNGGHDDGYVWASPILQIEDVLNVDVRRR